MVNKPLLRPAISGRGTLGGGRLTRHYFCRLPFFLLKKIRRVAHLGVFFWRFLQQNSPPDTPCVVNFTYNNMVFSGGFTYKTATLPTPKTWVFIHPWQFFWGKELKDTVTNTCLFQTAIIAQLALELQSRAV